MSIDVARLTRAKKAGQVLGRPRLDTTVVNGIRKSLQAGGKGIHKIAIDRVGSGIVQRIKAELVQE